MPEPGEGRTDVLSVAPSVQRVAVEAASYTDAFWRAEQDPCLSMEPQVAARPPTTAIQLGYLMAVFIGTVGEAAWLLYSPSQLLEGSTGRKNGKVCVGQWLWSTLLSGNWSGWILGKTSLKEWLNIGTDCPWRWWSNCLWRYLRNMEIWHWVAWLVVIAGQLD